MHTFMTVGSLPLLFFFLPFLAMFFLLSGSDPDASTSFWSWGLILGDVGEEEEDENDVDEDKELWRTFLGLFFFFLSGLAFGLGAFAAAFLKLGLITLVFPLEALDLTMEE